MTTTKDFADFIHSTDFVDLSPEVSEAVKMRVLDAVGIALGTVGTEAVARVQHTVDEIHPTGGHCTVWGTGSTAPTPEAAMINTALIRYADLSDSILLPRGTPHPSDNIGTAITTAEYEEASGEELLAGIAIAYELQGELSEKAPSGFNWDQIEVNLSNASVASKLLGLTYEQTRHAIGLVAAEYNQLNVIRRGELSMWKGLASGNRARNAVFTALLARNGVEGPVDAMEAEHGWKRVIQGVDFQLDLTPGERVLDVMTKKYMAGTHAQAPIEGILELIDREAIDPRSIESIHLDTYQKAIESMGHHPVPENRETADHSAQYTIAVAALDGEVTEEQYTQERIQSEDVRRLTRNVTIDFDPELHRLYAEDGHQAFDITVQTDDETYRVEKRDFEGHPHTPMTWDGLEEKFHGLAENVMDPDRRREVIETVKDLDRRRTGELTELL